MYIYIYVYQCITFVGEHVENVVGKLIGFEFGAIIAVGQGDGRSVSTASHLCRETKFRRLTSSTPLVIFFPSWRKKQKPSLVTSPTWTAYNRGTRWMLCWPAPPLYRRAHIRRRGMIPSPSCCFVFTFSSFAGVTLTFCSSPPSLFVIGGRSARQAVGEAIFVQQPLV